MSLASLAPRDRCELPAALAFSLGRSIAFRARAGSRSGDPRATRQGGSGRRTFVPARFDREYVHAVHASLAARGVEPQSLNRTHDQLNEELRSSQVRYRTFVAANA